MFLILYKYIQYYYILMFSADSSNTQRKETLIAILVFSFVHVFAASI